MSARCHLRADLACYYGACRNVWFSAPPLTWHGSISRKNPNYQLGIHWCCEGSETPCLGSLRDTDTWCCHAFSRKCKEQWSYFLKFMSLGSDMEFISITQFNILFGFRTSMDKYVLLLDMLLIITIKCSGLFFLSTILYCSWSILCFNCFLILSKNTFQVNHRFMVLSDMKMDTF